MELNELKILLDKSGNKPEARKDLTDLNALLNKRSGSLFAGIRRSICFEMLLAFVLIIATALLAFNTASWSLRIYSSIFCVASIIFVATQALLLKKINLRQKEAISLRQSILQTLSIIRNYSRAYFILSNVLVPACLLLALYLSLADPEREGEIYTITSKLLLAVAIFTVCIAMYFINKWYLGRLFGNTADKLEELLKELE